MNASKENLLKRYSDAKGNWELWRSIYDEAYYYTNPDRDPWPTEQFSGTRKNIEVYDITAVNSSRRLVSHLHGSLMPSSEQWFELEAGSVITDPDQRKILNQELQVFSSIIFKALNDSNFALSSYEMLQDLIIGTGALMCLEHDSPAGIKFKTVPLNQVYPEGDAWDEIETVWRDFKDVHYDDILSVWPKAVCTQEMTQQYKQDDCVTFDFIEGIVYNPSKKNYRHVVFECSSDATVLDLETSSSPWIVARWSKTSWEVGGRGPVIEALPTIRSLNKLIEFIMTNVALSTSPPWMATSDGVFNPYLFEVEPNKVIPISMSSMGNLPLKKLDVSGDVRMGTLEVEDLRAQIKDALFDNPIRPVNAPEQTATEIMIRQQQFAEEIGPAFGRLTVELLPKIINRVIFILQKRGDLPKNLKIDNKSISIRYKSPLLRGQNVQNIQNLQNLVSIMQTIAGPQLSMGALNLEQLPTYLADQLNVDETLIKSPAAIQKMAQGAQQAQQQAQQQAVNPGPPPNVSGQLNQQATQAAQNSQLPQNEQQ